uniref:Uncharacterized protein n=1 Tax=Timema bartmani TaxID=61472 RepID=A0A7R9HZ27_9NEOP|nr:unnamed protein product [Timema bartmani]
MEGPPGGLETTGENRNRRDGGPPRGSGNYRGPAAYYYLWHVTCIAGLFLAGEHERLRIKHRKRECREAEARSPLGDLPDVALSQYQRDINSVGLPLPEEYLQDNLSQEFRICTITDAAVQTNSGYTSPEDGYVMDSPSSPALSGGLAEDEARRLQEEKDEGINKFSLTLTAGTRSEVRVVALKDECLRPASDTIVLVTMILVTRVTLVDRGHTVTPWCLEAKIMAAKR